MNMKEIWKDISGYDGKYQVSNLGRVKSTMFINRNSITSRIKILKQKKEKDGYLRITLSKNNKSKTYLIHQLVAQAFIPNPNGYPIINHINEIKHDNRVENLEWCSYKYNVNYKNCQIKKGVSLKKKINQCDLEGNFIKQWNGIKDAGHTLKISWQSISQCCRGKRKTAGGFKWIYY